MIIIVDSHKFKCTQNHILATVDIISFTVKKCVIQILRLFIKNIGY